MDNIEKIGNLGKGSFAEVFLVRNTQDNQIYAMKQIILSKIPKSEQESALNEVRILASIEHPNIIDFKEVFIDEKHKSLNIIMEYANDKDLLSKIKYFKVMNKHITEDIIWDYLIQIIFGLKVLHDKKIIHRDLKSANIFISGNIIKIGDFNISKIVKSAFVVSSQTGTPYYASPEIWAEKPYDYRTDIWSLGCIIYELCSYRPPFLGMTADELYKNILKGKYEPIPKIYSSELSSVISKMLTVNQEKRPDCTKLLADPVIIQKIENFTNKTNFYANQLDVQMLNTIKFSYCLNELNKNLPKVKRYNTRSRSDKDILTFKNNLIFDNQQTDKSKEKRQHDVKPISEKKAKIESPASDNNSNDSTSCSTNNDNSSNLKSPENNNLNEVHGEHLNSAISIPHSNIKIKSILSRKKIGENSINVLPKCSNVAKITKDDSSKNVILENVKKVTIENIELAHLEDKFEAKVVKRDSKQNVSKPAFSTRNVLNIFNNNDIIKKIEGLKNHNKLVINSNVNYIDLSNSKNKLKIRISPNGNKENMIQDIGKKNVVIKNNIEIINNNVINN